VWDGTGGGARAVRTVLEPASALFGFGVARRNARFDAESGHENSRVRPAALPAISVGNLTVGGTGKTPVAAWCARQLRKGGGRPAIVLRGYGDDEWRVHTLLNPGVPVIVAPDRLNGMVLAKSRGANCVVLDDAFQHRIAARVSDVVLLSADQWTGHARLLPAGPFREPLSALKRATTVVITVKAAPAARIEALQAAIRRAAPAADIAVVRLTLGTLQLAVVLPDTGSPAVKKPPVVDGSGLLERSTEWLNGRNIVAVSAIGDPSAFISQLEQAGARVQSVRFRDHHAFTAADAASMARRAEQADGVVCTLKDAVKLGPLWPRVAPSLWYVSQSVVVERGASALDRALARVLAARVAIAPTAG
jgi:tetraacyldisaccharide 4'-kinase